MHSRNYLILVVLIMCISGNVFGQESTPDKTETMDDLYKLSTSYRDGTMAPKIDKARKAMIEMPEKTLEYIFKDKFYKLSNLEWYGVQSLLDGIGKPAVPYLLKTLTHEDPAVRRNSAIFLGRLKDEEAVEPLLNTLEDKELSVVLSAFESLADMKVTKALDKMTKHFNNPEERHRIIIARSLGKYKNKEVCPYLFKMLTDKICQVRYAASHSIINIGADSVAEVIKEIGSNKLPVQRQLFMILSQITDETAKVFLSKNTNNKDWIIRSFIVDGLSRETTKEEAELLETMLKNETHTLVKTHIKNTLKNFGHTIPETEYKAPEGEFPKPGPYLSKIEKDMINEVLEAINMKPEDLLFKRDYMDDDYRLNVAQKALADPFYTISFTQESENIFAKENASLNYYLSHMGEALDVGKIETKYLPSQKDLLKTIEDLQGEKIKSDISVTIPEFLNIAATILLLSSHNAQGTMDKAFEKLTDDDRLFVLSQGAYFLTRYENPLKLSKEELKEEYTHERFLEIMKKVDRSQLQKASIIFATGIEAARKIIKEELTEKVLKELSGNKNDILFQMNTPLGEIIIGNVRKNVYRNESEKSYFIIDLGGDDEYHGRFGAALGKKSSSFGVVIDISGDDLYRSKENLTQGAAIFGAAALVDEDGNDIYQAPDLAQGFGFFGSGMLLDTKGRDKYIVTSYGQGASCVGNGILIDRDGNDYYFCEAYSQACSSTYGYALLIDDSGNDFYTADGYIDQSNRRLTMAQGFSIGIRPVASGGVALLLDKKGDDEYSAHYYGQGVSYWFSFAMLIDVEGNDRYAMSLYGQGTGIHLTAGILVDHKGNDFYNGNRFGLDQGAAHDWAVGVLLDDEGNDHYLGGGTSHGGSLNNSIAIFIDKSGNDLYDGKSPTQGEGRMGRGMPSFGIFLDLHGNDIYRATPFNKTKNLQGNNSFWRKPFWGVGIDTEKYKP